MSLLQSPAAWAALALILMAASIRLSLAGRQRALIERDPRGMPARERLFRRLIADGWQSAWAIVLLLLGLPLVAWLEQRLGTEAAVALAVVVGILWQTAASPPGLRARVLFDGLLVLLFAALVAALAAWVTATARTAIGPFWWLTAWPLGLIVYPLWSAWRPKGRQQAAGLAPEPLDNGALKSRLESLLAAFGAESATVLCRRSAQGPGSANASVSGTLARPRIVLEEPLIRVLTPEQIEAVIAHEMAHLLQAHPRSRSQVLAAAGLATLAIVAPVADAAALAYGHAAALALAWALAPSAWLFLTPLVHSRTRAFEFEADRVAAAKTSASALSEALVALNRHNATAHDFDPWYALVFHPHPPPGLRIARLRET